MTETRIVRRGKEFVTIDVEPPPCNVGGRYEHPVKGPGKITKVELATDRWGCGADGYEIHIEYDDPRYEGGDIFQCKYLGKFKQLNT